MSNGIDAGFVLRHRIQESLCIIEKMLDLSKKPYIALSFGKDSLVMLDLVYSIAPGLRCLFLKSEETFLMYNYEDLIEHYTHFHGLNLHIVDTHRLSESNYNWVAARAAGHRDFMLDDFFEGYDGVFMGLRIEESKARRYTLIKPENNTLGKRIMQYRTGRREGMYRCCPMADWSAWEIRTYAEWKSLPLLDVYQEGLQIRTTARITGLAQSNNALFWLRKNKPENWQKIVQLLPELRHL